MLSDELYGVDTDDITNDLAVVMDEWITEQRRERDNPEWYPTNIHEIFTTAADRFELGDFDDRN